MSIQQSDLTQLLISRSSYRQFNTFTQNWERCTACPLSLRRTQVVHYRGRLPATVLFIGEAPGASEDTSGLPFTGGAGVLLQHWLSEAAIRLSRTLRPRFTWGVMNVVGCLSQHLDDEGDYVNSPPTPEEITGCTPRTVSLYQLARPHLLVLLGKTAEKILPALPERPPALLLPHPAFVLRRGGARSPESHEVVLRLVEFLTHYLRKPYYHAHDPS